MLLDILVQVCLSVCGLASLWMAQGHNPKARKWAPVVGLAGQPAWFYFAWSVGVGAIGIAVLTVAFTAVHTRGVWVQWGRK